ncbi:Ig-like domain-containing protein [Paraglaciecola aquimarina]|uniref:Ig-like domain-containing protein n=1 Tax=Paraglaciecola algarum TaxID=3050085 RepID=A0ABS9D3B8_9ALTE|nr:Ig-like domain-containing protein [Paraglaciecola sp. G1-23]MCF2946537.1 Ig-like domain-containing protein [Paraglaciecola sp. G1-23]
MKKNYLKLLIASAIGLSVNNIHAAAVKVDINLDVKHEVKGVSNFNREKHITVHSNLTEGDWQGEADVMNYLMNDLDVYFGRDNGMATWIFKATAQDPDNLGKPDLEDLANFGQWHKDNMYDVLPESIRAYEARSNEMIMGITPHGLFPTQSYWPKDLAGKEDETGQYVLRHIEDGAEWVGEYLDNFMRKDGETSGVLMPKYWEVINEPDMDINVGRTFVMSSFEQLFEYHNLVAEQIKDKLPPDQRPLVGGMTWGLHDLEQGDLSERFPTQERAVRSRYSYEAGTLEDYLQEITSSEFWAIQDDKYFQWDAIWKGFMDASGENMDFYSIHLYDWAQMGNNPRQGSTFRRGMKTEAILDMVEWYDAQVNGKDNLKPWVVSEYGAIASKHGKLEFITNDYRYADWLHLRTFNQMFMQLLTRPSQVVKSMPFSPIKGQWGLLTGPAGEAIRYEASLMQTDEALSENYEGADWYVTDKIQWYELWSDVKGTRVDTHSSDPDIQVDAYVDGNHTYLILNNLEWYDIPVDLSFMGVNGNTVKSVNMKHSYLAEGLSDINLGRPVLAEAMLENLPETVTLEPGSTIILDIEYNQDVAITSLSNEKKYYGESLSGAGKGEAAKGQIHRISGSSMTGNINGVSIPENGEATLRIAAEFYPFHAAKPTNNTFTINGHTLAVPTQINPNASGIEVEHYDYMGPEVDEGSVSLNLIEIPIPLELLEEDNVVTATVASARVFTAISLSIWEMDTPLNRSAPQTCNPCVAATDLSLAGASSVAIKESIALTATVLPANTDNKVIAWSSADVKIAAVDQNGLVTGTGGGTTTITATMQDGSLATQHQVTVTTIQASNIMLSHESAAMVVDESLQLDVIFTPFNVTTKMLTWESSNEAVATVDNNGLITAVGNGDTVITATAVGGASDVVNVNVNSYALAGVDLPSTSVIVLPGTYQAKVDFLPANATDKSVTWLTSNHTIATVDQNGLITGVAPGATTIKVTSNDGGHEDSIIVNVLASASQDTNSFVVEAETMNNTGGAFAGFNTSDVGINTNQTGDWAEFGVDFSEAGVYQLILDAGTPTAPENGAAVYVNGVLAGSASIPTTGSWDVMQSTVISNNILIPAAGQHTIRIESIGAEAKWQWNADKMRFVFISSLSPTLDPDVAAPEPEEPETPTEPGVTASLTLDDASKYLAATYVVGETLPVTANYAAGTGQTVTNAEGGVKFFLREMTSAWSVVKDTVAFDASAIGQTSGIASAEIPLTGLLPTAELPSGNFYFLYAAFQSTDGQTYKIGGVQPIKIAAEGTEVPTEPEEPTDPEAPAEPSFVLDHVNKYLNSVYAKGGNLDLTAEFNAGTDNTVVSSSFGGVNGGLLFILQELRADGSQVKRVVFADDSSIGSQNGTVNISLPLIHPTQGDLKNSEDLNAGHYYNLTARFKSSDGSTQLLANVSPIIIADTAIPFEPAEPSLTLDDDNKYLSTEYVVGESIEVVANYDAGADHTVTAAQGGVKFFLREMTSDWSAVVKDVLAFDASAIGQSSGTATANLSLADLTPSADLPDGNFYFLFASYASTDGTTYKIGGVAPIKIVAAEVEEPTEPETPVEETVDGDAFTIEAESFDATGGRVSGVTIGERGIPTDRRTVTDSNQNGDWVDYYLDFPADGFYRIDMVASSANVNSQAALSVDGEFVEEVAIVTGNQAVFESFTLTESIYLTAGTHTIRVEATSAGGNGWMWFGDTLTFTQLIANEPVEAILGDLDGDGDVDTLDVRLFQIGVRNGEITDLNFDFNNDGAVDTRDVRGFTGLCTRARCSTN